MAVLLKMLGVFLASAAVVFGVVYWYQYRHSPPVDVFDFYSKNMRSSLFSGFLTIGGFMLSLKTFVLVKMKEGLYGTEAYVIRVEKARKLGSEDSLYAPLKRLSHLLFASILAALTTAAFQLSLGLHQSWWSAGVCLSFATGTISLLLLSLLNMKRNLDTWFDSMDKDHERKRADASASRRTASEQ